MKHGTPIRNNGIGRVWGQTYQWQPHHTWYTHTHIFSLSVATDQIWPRLPHIVSRSHTIRHTHHVWFLWISDYLIAEASTYTTHNIYKTWLEPAIPATKQLQIYTLDCTATRNSTYTYFNLTLYVPCITINYINKPTRCTFICICSTIFVHSTCFKRLFRSSSGVHKLPYLQLCTNHANVPNCLVSQSN